MAKFPTFGAEFGLLVRNRRAALGLTSQKQLADLLNANAGKAGKITESEISRLENGRIPAPHEATVLRYREVLGIRDDEVNALRLAKSLPPGRQVELMAEITAASRKELDALALEFGIETPSHYSESHLRKLLLFKAEELKALQQDLRQMRGLSDRLDNLIPAIEQAVTIKDFKQARALLDAARDIQKDLLRPGLEANARLLERTAQIDLLESKPDDAYRHYNAAAESFGGIDPSQVIIRRDSYAMLLDNHSLRFGGTGMARAIDLWRRNLEVISKFKNSQAWINTQKKIANALTNQAERVEASAGTDLLEQAVDLYGQILTVATIENDPLQWAWIHNNRALVFVKQAMRRGGAVQTRLLAQAVWDYRMVLRLFSDEYFQDLRAAVHMNLANTLCDQATLSLDGDGFDLLAEAVESYKEAGLVYTRERSAVEWATIQNNRASIMCRQAEWLEGEARADLLKEAIAGYELAHEVRTPEDYPIEWAMTMDNIALAKCEYALHLVGSEGVDLLLKAVANFEEALRVRTLPDHPTDWARTTQNVACAYFCIAVNFTTADPRRRLQQALEHVDAALTVFDPVHMAPDHRKATALREYILAAFAALKP